MRVRRTPSVEIDVQGRGCVENETCTLSKRGGGRGREGGRLSITLLILAIFVSDLSLQALEQQYSDLQPSVSEAIRQANMFAAQSGAQTDEGIVIHYSCKCLKNSSINLPKYNNKGK